MKKITYLLLFVLSVSAMMALPGADTTYMMKEEPQYANSMVLAHIKKGKVVYRTLSALRMKDIRIYENEVTGINRYNRKEMTIPNSEIYCIEYTKGSYATLGFFSGAATMALISAYGVDQVEKDPDMVLRDDANTRIAITVLSGGLLGAILGYTKKKYEYIYFNQANNEKEIMTFHFTPIIYQIDQNMVTGLNFSIRF